ncbi:phasin family protein [Undibacterium amnicola]|uniref:Phasin family protein n=1 Tax=Undibacterium amnicola TaxID=1834038 RepID=A0ABR6XSP0_9BURK|nr:phasin family protein [Undibacterium amnicola]MBC3832388.1 phasin family protein [Undibacterium amnicola]
MYTTPEQFIAATKTNLEAQFAAITALNQKAFEGLEQFVSLNVNAAKATFEEGTAATQQLLNAKDAQELIALASAQAKPNAEKALAYGRHLATITSATQQEFTKAVESHIAETNAKVVSLIDEVTKNAPAGSEQAVTALKSVVGNINAGYEQMSKTTKQAVATLEDNLANATKQFTQAAEKATTTAKKK